MLEKMKNLNGVIKAIIFFIIVLCITIILAPETYAAVIEPTSEQKVEYRAVQIEENNGKGQLIVEVWIKNLDFKGIDLRLKYDTNLLNTSDLTTNEIINLSDPLETPSNFEFADNFKQYMEITSVSATSGELRMIYSLLSYLERTGTDDYLIEDGTSTGYVHITDAVLIGRLSFQIGEGEITEDALALKEADTYPTTGISVNISGETGDNYEDQSLFEFVLDLASKNANLSDLQTDLIEITDFDKEQLEYEIELLEEVEKIIVKPTPEDEKATITIEGNIVNVEEGQEIILNPLGEETIVKILVTAEDTKYTKEYILTIKRPCGILKGQVNILATSTTTGKYIAQIRIFKAEDVAEILDWEEVKTNFAKTGSDDVHSKLGTITEYKIVTTNEDGSYQVDISKTGTYNVVITKDGYLNYEVSNIEIQPGNIVELDSYKLIAGDIVKTGEIEINDLVALNDKYGTEVSHEIGGNDQNVKYDLNEDGIVDKVDRNILKKNYGKAAETVEWANPNAVAVMSLRVVEEEKQDFIVPMTCEYTITSEYGYRVHPTTGEYKKHTGIDLAGEHHTEILAVADGEVTFSGVQNGFGNCVEIKHVVNGETIYSFYAHLSRIDVQVGDKVVRGQTIGLEGGDPDSDPNPGNSTGHHLHFEIRNASGYGNDVDPNDYIEF